MRAAEQSKAIAAAPAFETSFLTCFTYTTISDPAQPAGAHWVRGTKVGPDLRRAFSSSSFVLIRVHLRPSVARSSCRT
jgi:hypothetical protein